MNSHFNRSVLIALSVALLVLIVIAALGPARSIPRTGLGWQFDHFAGYLVFTSLFCQIWRRVLMTGLSVTAFALILEICQGLTPDRNPDFMGAFYSVSGVVTAALLADVALRARKHVIGALFLRPLS
jgi:predicted membrane protein